MKKSYSNKITNEELFQLIKNDDQIAFSELYNRFWDKLYNIACNKLYDNYLAEDVIQELFADLWKRRCILDIKTSANAYLATALKYRIIKARLRQAKENDQKVEIEKYDISDGTYSAQDNLSFLELKDKLEVLIKHLPEKCQLVYRLNREEGLSSRLISEKLNLSQKTVESHLYRALKSLKDGLLVIAFQLYALKLKIYKFNCSVSS